MTDYSTETDQQYQTRLQTVIARSFTVPLISLGLDLGLFDVLERLEKPETSQVIAAKANLKHRYVKEWLDGMYMGGVITYNTTDHTYYISKTRAQMLPALGIFSKFMTDTCNTRTVLKSCMQPDGPDGFLPWEHGDFSTRMRLMKNRWLSHTDTLDKYIDAAPGLRDQLESGINICEIGSNYGSVLIELAKRYPNSTFTGFDICEETVVGARKTASDSKVNNISFAVQDLHRMPESLKNSYDLVLVFDVIHDCADPGRAVSCIYESVKPGGLFLLVDINCHSKVEDNINNPNLTLVYTASMHYCLGVSRHHGGEGAGASYGKENITRDVHAAGFTIVNGLPLPNEPVLYLFVCKK